MNTQRIFRFAFILGLVGLFSAACSTPTTEPTAVPATTTSTASTIPPDEPDRSATLTAAYASGPSSFDPLDHLNSATGPVALNFVYDRLVHVLPNGELTPGLAESWTVEGEIITFKIRKGVTFHDGAPFDAFAAKTNLDRLSSQAETGKKQLPISAVTAESPDTLLVEVEELPGDYIRLLSGPAGMMVSPAELSNPNLKTSPVGTGRFTITGVEDFNNLTFTRFESYWQPSAVPVSQLTYRVVPDPAMRVAGVENGEFDYVQMGYGEPVTIPEESSTVVNLSVGERFMHMQFNRARSNFGDVRVRNAMNLALDQNAILSTLSSEQPYGERTSGPFPDTHYAASDVPPAERDVVEAKSLLAAAGLTESFGFELLYPANPQATIVAQMVRDQLAELNITVSLVEVAPENLNQMFYVEQKGDAALLVYENTGNPAVTMRSLYLPSENDVNRNPGGHEIVGLSETFATLNQAVTVMERTNLLKEAVSTVVVAAAEVWLFSPYAPTLMNETVLGYEEGVVEYQELRGVGKQSP